jgi:hypothetical protein
MKTFCALQYFDLNSDKMLTLSNHISTSLIRILYNYNCSDIEIELDNEDNFYGALIFSLPDNIDPALLSAIVRCQPDNNTLFANNKKIRLYWKQS